MSKIRNVATVFGGTGFVGRYIVSRLLKQGYVVRVSVPSPALTVSLRTMGDVGQMVPLYSSVTKEETVARAVEGAEIVVNASRKQFSHKKPELNRLNVDGAGRVARLCAAAGVKKLIHLSTVGADENSNSLFLQSRKIGENEVRKFFPAATIIRHTIPFGIDDHFLNVLARQIKALSIMLVYKSNVRLQPVYVGDIADAVIRIINLADTNGHSYEIAGPEVYTNHELISWMIKWLHQNTIPCAFPAGLMTIMAKILQNLPGSFMNASLLNMMNNDCVLNNGVNDFDNLGIKPMSIGMLAPEFLFAYRPANDFENAPV